MHFSLVSVMVGMKTVRPSVMGKKITVLILWIIAQYITDVVGQTTHYLPWSLETNFLEWDKNNTIYVNDRIVFNYEPSYTLTEVNFRGYINCNTTNPISNYEDGLTQMEMTQTGTRYFISSATGSCDFKHFFVVKSRDLLTTSLVAHTTLQVPPAPAPASVPYMNSGGGGDGMAIINIVWIIIGGLMLAH
ncbi:early nodulin-like protein 1 [Pistacia vera]|uniref:early nodulin-like protein 1 n=1 Tax=Pistacia vera TaxID=55513 RepID=UPI0012637661|nr:early nodulin-like protein 1 [Pistacia vera]